MAEVLKQPAIRSKLTDAGLALSRGGAEFAKFIAGETVKYRQIVESANIKTE